MATLRRCMDTYALVEIAEANPKFAPYLNVEFVITELTLAEFYGVLLRDKNLETAEYWYKVFEPYGVPVEKALLIEAVRFRYQHRKSDISFFDAVGYIFATKHGYPFLTGDKEFENFAGVEFVKK